MFDQLKSVARKGAKISTVSALAVGSFAVNAADYTESIATASSEASTNITAVVAAVIGLAVIGFGVNAVVNWMKR